jgi:hypothetical protein
VHVFFPNCTRNHTIVHMTSRLFCLEHQHVELVPGEWVQTLYYIYIYKITELSRSVIPEWDGKFHMSPNENILTIARLLPVLKTVSSAKNSIFRCFSSLNLRKWSNTSTRCIGEKRTRCIRHFAKCWGGEFRLPPFPPFCCCKLQFFKQLCKFHANMHIF